MKCIASIRTRGAAENIANSPPMIRLHGRGRNDEAAIGDQADIVLGDRERIERDPRRVMGFAEHRAIGDGAERGEGCDKDEFGAPAESDDRARRRAAARSRAPPPSRS